MSKPGQAHPEAGADLSVKFTKVLQLRANITQKGLGTDQHIWITDDSSSTLTSKTAIGHRSRMTGHQKETKRELNYYKRRDTGYKRRGI